MTHHYGNIPDVFRQYRQWVVWTNRDEQGKPTKRPLRASDGYGASTTNSDDWTDYDTAVATAKQYPDRVAGIGFVLTADDPFVCIDIDDPTKHGFDQENVNRIFRLGNNVIADMNSYTELSPSGNGVHVWVKADLPPEGVKSSQDCIEIYSSARFMTFTGNIMQGSSRDVEERPEASIIYDALARISKPLADIVEQECNEPATEIINKIKGWANGETFWRLFNMTDEEAGNSKSEVDQGLMNFLVLATQNVAKTKELFAMSERGKRDKAKREDYIERTIRRAFDKMNETPLIDIGMLIAVGKEQLQRRREHEAARERYQAEGKPFVPTQTELEMYPNPGGLLGHIADAIYASSYKPRWTVALAGAIGLMAGIAGRAYNVAGVGLNQYVAVLAPTAYGKDAALSGPGKIVRWLEKDFPPIKTFIGPRSASAQALAKSFSKKPSYVTFYDEWGEIFEKMSNPDRYPNQAAIAGATLELYSCSKFGSSIPDILHSGTATESTKDVPSPSYSFVGVSVPSTFWGALSPKMGHKGMTSRLTIIVCPNTPETFNDDAHLYKPPQWLLNDLKTVASQSVMSNNSMNLSGIPPIEIGWSGEVKTMWEQFRNFTSRKKTEFSDNEVVSQVWDRTAEKAKRLAGLVAVGYAPLSPVVKMPMLEWAIAFSNREAELVTAKFLAGEVGQQDNETERFNDFKSWVRKWIVELPSYELGKDDRYPLMRAHSLIPKSWLFNKLRKLSSFRNYRDGASTGLDRLVTSLKNNGVIDVRKKPVSIGPIGATTYDGDVITVLNNEAFDL